MGFVRTGIHVVINIYQDTWLLVQRLYVSKPGLGFPNGRVRMLKGLN